VKRLTAGVLALAAVLGSGPSASAQTQAKNPFAAIVVPRAQLGKIAQGLQVELISGSTSNQRVADDSFDPNDTAASVQKAGRLFGYILYYGDPGATALRRDRGVLYLGTSLEYFKTFQQATVFELKSLADLRRVRGKNLQGVVIERSNAFAVGGLGPGSIGLEIVQRVGKHRIYSTVIDFQIDRILCEAVINRTDKLNVRKQVAKIAQTLRNRIAAYGASKLNAQPVPLPRPLGTVKPGAGAPDLTAMVPTPADLKGKAGLDQQAFVPDDQAITSYVREFRFGPSSGLFSLRTTAALQRSRREASGRVFVLRSVFSGPEAAETLAKIVAPNATLAHLDGTRSAKVGDESFATAVSFTSRGERFRAVLVYERRDRIVGSMIMVGKAGKLKLEGSLSYARMLDKRIKAGLKPALVA
jgi:hypothetical protein